MNPFKCKLGDVNGQTKKKQTNKMSLTRGALARICAGEHVPHPELQVLGYKQTDSGNYRLILSDGEQTYSGVMLWTQLNPMIHDGKLEKFTIIRVDKYVKPTQLQFVEGKRPINMIILIDVSVVQPGYKVADKFGIPLNKIPCEIETEQPMGSTLENDGQHELNEGGKVEAIYRKQNEIPFEVETEQSLGSTLANGQHEVNGERRVQAICRKLNNDRQHEANEGRKDQAISQNTNYKSLQYGMLNFMIKYRVASIMGRYPENDGQHKVNNRGKDQAMDNNLKNDGQRKVNEESKDHEKGSNLENDGQIKINEGTKDQAMGRNIENDEYNKVNEGRNDQAIGSNLENDGQNKVNEGRNDQATDSNLENDGQHEVNEVENDKKKKKIKPKCARASCENQGRHRCSRCKAIYYCQQECLEEDWSHHKMYCDYVYKANKVPHDSNSKDTEEMENKDTGERENSGGREEVD